MVILILKIVHVYFFMILLFPITLCTSECLVFMHYVQVFEFSDALLGCFISFVFCVGSLRPPVLFQ